MFDYHEGHIQSKYRSKVNNVLKIKALFYEHSHEAVDQAPLYTLRDRDWDHIKDGVLLKTYPSLYRLYMDLSDLTEFEFASRYLESYDHWKRLCDARWFANDYLPRWRRDLEFKIKHEALEAIKDEARRGSKFSFAANKYLFERGVIVGLDKKKDAKKLKEQLIEQANREQENLAMGNFEEDLKRLNLDEKIN